MANQIFTKRLIDEMASAEAQFAERMIAREERAMLSSHAQEYYSFINAMPRQMFIPDGAPMEAFAPMPPWIGASAAPQSAIAVVEPTTALLEAPDTSQREFLTEYQKLATKIGYHCAEAARDLAEGELVAWLHEQAMPVYDYAAVKKYLDGTVAEMNAKQMVGHAWRWYPLRKCDSTNYDPRTHENLSPYSKPIPYPVLCAIEKVVDQFGERVQLLVSDIYTVPKADPFLAVRVPGSERLFVIERWDEPKFRG